MMEKSIMQLFKKCHPLHIASASVLCSQVWAQVSVGVIYSKNTQQLLSPMFFLLELVTIHCFNQEEINSPRDKYWSSKVQDWSKVIGVVATQSVRGNHSVKSFGDFVLEIRKGISNLI